MTATAETPMMQQYRAAKEAHPGMLLLFRMGDFYESFDDDARTAAKLLGLTLTTRDKQVAMAGFPHHQLENCLAKLLRHGQRFAVCDLVEPTDQPGEVNRIVTPGEIAADSDAAEREELDAIARDAAERLGALLVFVRDIGDGLTNEVYGDDAEKLASLIPVQLQRADGIRWVVLPGDDAYAYQDALNEVNDAWLTWDTSESDAENWSNVTQFFKDDEPDEEPAAEPKDHDEDDEPAEDPTPAAKPPKPCLRCGNRLHPRCSTCKMCAPCCWCPKS